MTAEGWSPKGIEFFSHVFQRKVVLIGEGERHAGWLCYQNRENSWVLLRKAGSMEILDVSKLVLTGHVRNV